MSAEFYVVFDNPYWLENNFTNVLESIRKLPTFIGEKDGELLLRGPEPCNTLDQWAYDVRIFPKLRVISPHPKSNFMLEITTHPSSVSRDLISFLAWLRSQTSVRVEDEDEELSDW